MRYFLLFLSFFIFEDQNEWLKQLGHQSAVAIQEKDPMMKEEGLNQIFAQYASLAQEYQPSLGNGKLYYNLANSYYHLGQYPYALLYYYKAQKLRPWDPWVQKNIEAVQAEMSLDEPALALSAGEYFFLAFLPMPLKLQLFALFTGLFLLFSSLYLWWPNMALKFSSFVSMIFLIVISLSMIYSYYFSPIEGVIMNASYLYQAPNENLEAGKKLIPIGSRVTLLEVASEGKMLKVTTYKGDLGYLASETVKVI